MLTAVENINIGLLRYLLQFSAYFHSLCTTFLEMFLTALLGFEQSVTGTADEVFVIGVNCLVHLQILRFAETLRTFGTNIRWHILMYKQVILQLTLLNKLLRTDVTREPSANVVGLQQMPLALVLSLKTDRAVPARKMLRARVHSNMKPQAAFGLK